MAATFSHTVDADQATFLGMVFEALAYGIYTLLFFTALAVLTWRTPALNASKTPMFATAIFMYCLATVHFSLNFNNVYQGLMVKPKEHISEETNLLAGADMIFSITDFCSQLILIYRCYLVWGRNLWVVVLPVLISLASVACGIALIGLVLTINPTAPQAPEAIVPVGTAAFALSLCLNFIVSVLIVGRIWNMTRGQSALQQGAADSAVKRASAIIIESGLLFLAAQFVFVVLFAIKHPAQAILVPIATQIYGISPTLIIVRVGTGSSFEATRNAGPVSSIKFVSLGKKVAKTGSSGTQTAGTSEIYTDTELGDLGSEPTLSTQSRTKQSMGESRDLY